MRHIKKHRVENTAGTAVALISPALVVMGVVMVYPLISSAWLSLFNYQLTRPGENAFVFLENYARLFKDSTLAVAFKNTVVFTFSTVMVSMVIGLITALVLEQLGRRFERIRGLLLVPWVIPGIVVGYLFMYMFDVDVGVINLLLKELHILDKYVPWLMNERLAMVAVITAHVWNQAPFYMLMDSAGLKSIPGDIREAAYVEGANRWQEFCYVTLPHLKSILAITSLLMIIRNFNNFPIIFTMTGGGPVYSTTTSVLYIYRLAFEQFDMGYASTVGILWVMVLLGLSAVYIRLIDKDF